MYVLVAIFACAVDLFMIISGYFMYGSDKRSLWKPIELVVQVIVFNEISYLIRILNQGGFSLRSVIGNLIPANYFVILYCAAYFLSPVLSRAFRTISQYSFKRVILLMLMLLSVWPTVVDFMEIVTGISFAGMNTVGLYGDQNGYSLVNFLLCWSIGAYLKECEQKVSKNVCILEFLVLTVLSLLYAQIVIACTGAHSDAAFPYSSPIIVLQAASVFSYFTTLKMGVNKAINLLAKGSFGVYLLHSAFLRLLDIQGAVNQNIGIMVAHVVLSALTIYLLCWCVHMIYSFVSAKAWKWIQRRISLPDLRLDDK